MKTEQANVTQIKKCAVNADFATDEELLTWVRNLRDLKEATALGIKLQIAKLTAELRDYELVSDELEATLTKEIAGRIAEEGSQIVAKDGSRAYLHPLPPEIKKDPEVLFAWAAQHGYLREVVPDVDWGRLKKACETRGDRMFVSDGKSIKPVPGITVVQSLEKDVAFSWAKEE